MRIHLGGGEGGGSSACMGSVGVVLGLYGVQEKDRFLVTLGIISAL